MMSDRTAVVLVILVSLYHFWAYTFHILCINQHISQTLFTLSSRPPRYRLSLASVLCPSVFHPHKTGLLPFIDYGLPHTSAALPSVYKLCPRSSFASSRTLLILVSLHFHLARHDGRSAAVVAILCI